MTSGVAYSGWFVLGAGFGPLHVESASSADTLFFDHRAGFHEATRSMMDAVSAAAAPVITAFTGTCAMTVESMAPD